MNVARSSVLRLGSLAMAFAVLQAQPQPEVTGARIRDRADITLHVDTGRANASDGNRGDAGAPLRSIQAAADRALENRRLGRSTRVVVHAGEYREAIELNDASADAGAPLITIEGSGSGEVIISGADLWTGWLHDQAGPLYRKEWPHRRGLAPLPDGWEPVAADLRANPIVRRSEMVVVNGDRLEQVMVLPRLRLEAGTFHVEDATPARPGTIRLHPRGEADPGHARVEVAIRPVLFTANHIGNLVLRGLTFRYAATPLQDGAVRINSCANVLLEDLRIVSNNWNGLALHESRDITVRRVTANDNGAGGLGAWRARNLLIEDVEASRNNWRGAAGQFTGWATGQKFFYVHDAMFRRFRAVGNAATGLWFDTDHSQITVEQARLCENRTRGLFLEAVQGPFVLRDSVICDNGEIGIFATSVANLTLERNRITGNGQHQVWIPWMDDHHVLRHERDYETGRPLEIRSERWTMTANTIAGSDGSLLFSVGEWPFFFSTLRSDRNDWSHGDRADVFATYPRIHASAARMDFAAWQRKSRQDRTSSFSASKP